MPLPAEAHDEAASLDMCVSKVLTLNLLGGAGDGPLIPVKIEGRDVAMYVDFAFGRAIWLRNGDNLSLPSNGRVRTIMENGDHREDVTDVMLEDFSIGATDFGSVQASLVSGYVSQSVAGRPIAGVIGPEIFRGRQVILDMPHRILASFLLRSGKPCRDMILTLLGGMPVGGDLGFDQTMQLSTIPVTIDGQKRDFYLDFDMNENIVPQDWTDLPEIAAGERGETQRVMTQYSGGNHDVSLGHLITLKEVRIAGRKQVDFTVLAESRTQGAMLGMPFF